MKHWICLVAALLLGACKTFPGEDLKPGVDTQDKVVQAMGNPALRWDHPDGSAQLVYPRGPLGYQTYIATLGNDGKLQKIENVLTKENFARIKPDMTQDEVLHILGPAHPSLNTYFKSRDELVWEWRYCTLWNEAARFDVMFDNSKSIVRKTQNKTEAVLGMCGDGACLCSQ